MKKPRFGEIRIVAILKQADAGMPATDACRQAGFRLGMHDQWKSRYGGMEASDGKRVKELEAENARLKRLDADLAVENVAMKDLIAKNFRPGAETGSGAVSGASAPSAPASVLRLRRDGPVGVVRAAAGLDGA